jgi:hypothetical protein
MAEKKSEATASESQNSKLQHSQGGVTTRDDAADLGVPMLPGDPSEPQGPEDALGDGPKRGDYTNRLGGDGYQPHRGSEAQRAKAADRGDAKGLKGGVDTQ